MSKRGKLFIIFILVIVAILIISFEYQNILLVISNARFYRLIQQNNFDDLNLTIYYMNPTILTLSPVFNHGKKCNVSCIFK